MFVFNNSKQVQTVLVVLTTSTLTVVLLFAHSLLSTRDRFYFREEEFKGSNKERNTTSVSGFKIGILIPSCTRTLEKPALSNISLVKICLPSIYKFMETKYNYMIYVGIDKGDFLETFKEYLETKFDKMKVVVASGGSFTKTVNAIAREAYKDGMDYLVRINDDTTFETDKWTSQGIQTLQKFSPVNIGVVGPTCKEGNTAILTHDMVHRTHLEIFDFYYPPYFDNWWADDWITNVYQPNRSIKLQTWKVKHHVKIHKTRYKVDYKQKIRLNKTLTFDRERLSQYLGNMIANNKTRDTRK